MPANAAIGRNRNCYPQRVTDIDEPFFLQPLPRSKHKAVLYGSIPAVVSDYRQCHLLAQFSFPALL